MGAGSIPAAPLPFQLPAVARESSRGWPRALGPCTRMGYPEEAPGSWLQIGSALASAVISGVNQGEEIFLSLLLSVNLPFQ